MSVVIPLKQPSKAGSYAGHLSWFGLYAFVRSYWRVRKGIKKPQCHHLQDTGSRKGWGSDTYVNMMSRSEGIDRGVLIIYLLV